MQIDKKEDIESIRGKITEIATMRVRIFLD